MYWEKKGLRTSIEEIVDYWFSIVDKCDLSVDAAEAYERCWRCGCEKSLERCHIIPEPLGGGDKPSNLVLLCHRCHLENPNVSDPEIMWDWLRADGTSFYDTFWTSVSKQSNNGGHV
ncbi:HNH endonuclease [Desulfotomaculum sp. 1211_IL3151]|uniref:HNH endonuclease n=1 Tax=Desulfotomaculum sp. 1211_IL3151 TaxID=3084055 RepID=UPI002FDA6452